MQHAPATPRQLLVVYVCVLAAVALQWNRDALPSWAKPELRPRSQTAKALAGLAMPEAFNLISLRGRPTLIVGDSLVYRWPWPDDRISYLDMSAPELRDEFQRLIQGRRYEQIVLWCGTAHIRNELPIDTYVDATVDMVRIAREHAERVALIGPMPWDLTEQEARAFDYLEPGGTLTDTDGPSFKLLKGSEESPEKIAQAVAALRQRLPDVPYVDTIAFRKRLRRQGKLVSHTVDGVHLTTDGFLELLPELTRAGVQPGLRWGQQPGAPQS